MTPEEKPTGGLLMLPSYVVAQVDPIDSGPFEEYKAAVPEVVRMYGGEYLARGGRYQRLEGREPLTRHVIMRFPSYDQALAWYHSAEYKRLKDLRLSGASGDIVLIEGLR
jgi:uncharacterized protein (DUF1330 family)